MAAEGCPAACLISGVSPRLLVVTVLYFVPPLPVVLNRRILRPGDRGLYVSTGGFTREARYEGERATHPATLIDLGELASLVIQHYESFDVEGRVLLPLVRVYLPAE
jgi:hypothetical protein